MRRTKADAAKTRENLLNAGLRVFRQKGYSATRLEDIAQEAGLTRGAIYWHFGNKLELYRALVEECTAKIQKKIGAILSTELSPFQKIREVVTHFLSRMDEDNVIHDIYALAGFRTEMTKEIQPTERPFVSVLHQIVELFASLGEAAQAKGEIRADINPRDLAWAIVVYFRGALSFSMDEQKLFSSGGKAEALVDLFLKGVTKK